MTFAILAALGGATLLAVPALAQTTPQQLDTIFMVNGEKNVGRLIGIDAQNFKQQKRLPAPAGAPEGAALMYATVTIPRKDVAQIEFAPDDARDTKIAMATVAQLPQIEVIWKQYEPWLGVPKSPAGKIGLAYGELLLKSGSPADAQKALEIFRRIETESWNDDNLILAKQGRLRGMVATGHAMDAVKEAKEFAKSSEDPAVLIEAKYILADAADKTFRKLVEDNPRWQIDLNILPERNRLYAETLEYYLFPYLFYGSEVEPAARGLSGALGVYQFTGEAKLAEDTALDLVTIYPGTKYAEQARQYLDSLPKTEKKEPASADPK